MDIALQRRADGTYFVTIDGKEITITIPEALMQSMMEGMMSDKAKTEPAATAPALSDVISLTDYTKGSRTKAGLSGKYITADVLLERDVDALLDSLQADTRVMPTQRAFYRNQALSDLPAFSEFAKTLKPQVDLKQRGTGLGNDGAPGDVDIAFIKKHPKNMLTDAQIEKSSVEDLARHQAVLKLTDERNCDYGKALSLVD